MKNITLVTGGAGFVGLALVKALLARGETVRVLDLDPGPLADLDVEVIEGSITDHDTVARAFGLSSISSNVTSVFHLAGNAQLWSPDQNVFDAVNHLGTINIINGAKQAGVARFIQCSSLTTLVGEKTPIGLSSADETIQFNPEQLLGPYPASKRRADIAVLGAASDEFSVSIAIPTEPLGAGDRTVTPPTQMILDFVNGKTPAYIDCILNFVPVDALAQGLISVRDHGANGEGYVLGGQNLSLHLLLDKLAARTGRKMPSLKMPYQVALLAGFIDTNIIAAITGKPPKAPLTGVRLAGRQVAFSSDKARDILGWQASDVDQALDEMLDWAREEGLINPVF